MNHHLRQTPNTASISSKTRPREEQKLSCGNHDKEKRASRATRRQANGRRAHLHMIIYWMRRHHANKKQQERSSSAPPLLKFVIHHSGKITSDSHSSSSSSNNTSPASSRAASPERITRFTTTHTLVNPRGQMYRLKEIY